MCLWVLAFNGTVVARLDAEASRIITALATTLRDAKKEKLVRVCLACFRVWPCKHNAVPLPAPRCPIIGSSLAQREIDQRDVFAAHDLWLTYL